MAKRFTDTSKYKKPFFRTLPGSYKLLWDFLYHDCDHAGIWIVDFEVAQMYLGNDMKIDKKGSLEFFNADEIRIVEIDGGKKWFIPSFIHFQYGQLSEKNRAHISAISLLKKYGLIDSDLKLIIENKPLPAPLQGAKDKELDKDKEKDKDKVTENEKNETPVVPINEALIPSMMVDFKIHNPKYFEKKEADFVSLREIAENICKWDKVPGLFTDFKNSEIIRLRWGELCEHIKTDSHLSKYSLSQISKHFQSIIQSFSNAGNKKNSGGLQKSTGLGGKSGGFGIINEALSGSSG